MQVHKQTNVKTRRAWRGSHATKKSPIIHYKFNFIELRGCVASISIVSIQPPIASQSISDNDSIILANGQKYM